MSGEVVLVVGSGGREHALGLRLAECASVGRVVVTPGNAGTRASGLESREGDVQSLAEELSPDLVVVGPEAPLCEGLVDRLEAAGHRVYGPNRAAAELEASKAFMKAFCERHQIRTARHVTVERSEDVARALASFQSPPVVKASGLCAGKGVVVAETFGEAEAAALGMLSGDAFGAAGAQVVLEERLLGQEISVHAVCDGTRGWLLPAIQDHKRIFDGDLGPNTGGMGTYGPAPVADEALMARVQVEIVDRVLAGMASEGRPFKGTLFAGLMVSAEGVPSLLEINVRFGDPETQVLVNLIDGDFYQLLKSAASGALDGRSVAVAERYGMCVVLAAANYPASPRTGDLITGLDAASAIPGVRVYHAGTALQGQGVVTAGGRVLGVSAAGGTLEEAKELAYRGCDAIHFDGVQLRRDIGYRALGPVQS